MKLSGIARAVAMTVAGLVAGSTVAAAPALAAPPQRPPIYLTTKPLKVEQSAEATFAWTSTGAYRYTCSLDGVSESCSSPWTYRGLADGTHTFVVRGRVNGKGKPASASYTWTVDSTPPSAPQITPLASPTSSTSATVTFLNTDPSSRSNECRVDSGPVVACASPFSVAGPLPDGSHTVTVWAVDAFDRRSTPASVTWVVDAAAPGTVQVAAPRSPSNDTSVSIPFSATDAVSYSCTFDGGAAQPCTSPFTATGLADGIHTLTVVASDASGNRSNPGTVAWAVDTVAPAVPSIVTGPADRTSRTSAAFVLSGVDASATVYCLLDGTRDVCPANLFFAGPLPVGVHRLSVQAEDQAGNVSDYSDEWVWEVVSSLMTGARITDGPLSVTNDPTPVFTFEFEADPGTALGFECAMDQTSSWTPCETGVWPWYQADDTTPIPTAGDGRHQFYVRTTDGTATSGHTSWIWYLDTTPPAVPTFSTTPASSTTDTTAVFSFASLGTVAYHCAIDGAALDPCTSPVTLRDLAPGSHTFTVTAEDGVHNVSAPAAHTWTVVTPATGDGGGTGGGATGGGATPAPTAAPAPPTPSGNAQAVIASITPSTALRGTSTVRFSSPVVSVSPSAVHLRVAGSTTDLPVTLRCASPAAAPVACSAGPVAEVSVQPRSALIPGQQYTLSTSGLTTGLVAVAAAEKGFRASTDEQENSLRAAGTWKSATAKGAYGRRYLTESRKGATLTVPFRGPRVTWFTMTGPSQGKATVYVDGVRKAVVNNFSAGTRWHVPRTVKGLSKKAHQLRIVVMGRKGSRAATGTGVSFDALRVGRKVTVNPAASVTWGTARNKAASSGAYAVSGQAKASMSFTFRGTAVSWVTATGPAMGKAKVYLDGVLKATVDNFSKRSRWNVRRTITGLSDTTHTVKVVVLGKKRAAARGTNVLVDRWIVR